MAVLTVQDIPKSNTGLAYALVAAAGGGDSWVNTGTGIRFFAMNNQDASSTTVTIHNQTIANWGGADSLHDLVLTVPATTTWFVLVGGPRSRFNDTNGDVQVTYSSVTSLTVNPFQLASD